MRMQYGQFHFSHETADQSRLTLQGLPLDSEVTNGWHSDDCDGSDSCPCKLPKQLGKGDLDDSVLQLTLVEEQKNVQFLRLMSWGNSRLWNKLTDEIIQYLDDDTPASNHGPNIVEEEILQISNSVTESDEPIDEDEIDVDVVLRNESMPDDYVLDNFEFEEIDTYMESFVNLGDASFDISDLEKSFVNISITDEETQTAHGQIVQDLLLSFGFKKFKVPDLLSRHPPPAIGRDDDIYKIREILDDVLIKMGYMADPAKSINRILCGADNKIGKSVLDLFEADIRYKAFLVEFPLLHLRKSKITILFSAYKEAGIVQMVKYMRDDDQDDWKKLVSAQHIDTATKHVKRVAIALHLAFIIAFSNTLDNEQKQCFLTDMDTLEPIELAANWEEPMESFLKEMSERNATFALHVDMMHHCDHIVAIALAERLGGPDGYALLLAAVKKSLRFSFVNNATSYAPYCVRLLYQHYSAGHYHQCLKTTLFTTPFKNSKINYACDTKREIDHIDAMKGFRSGSNIAAVTCRMSLMDSLRKTPIQQTNQDNDNITDQDSLGWDMTETDEKHIFPLVELILRQGGLQTNESNVPFNVYSKTQVSLPQAILDRNSDETGEYFIKRYLSKEGLFQMTEKDLPSTVTIFGPKELVQRANKSKGITIKRTTKSKVQTVQTDRQHQETKRQKEVAKELKVIDCLSSNNNACQAILKPDSSKPKVMKAIGMQRALKQLLTTSLTKLDTTHVHTIDNLIKLNHLKIPDNILNDMSICSVEFAGIKFKVGNVKTGNEYLLHIESTLRAMTRNSNNLKTFVICEEKYSYTPDDLKANTRAQRNSTTISSVDHLKTGANVINETVFNKEALTKTMTGKKAISMYLAQNIQQLQFGKDVDLIVDSELYQTPCICNATERCSCNKYCIPIIRKHGHSETSELSEIRQRKGEAEMAVADWIIYLQNKLVPGECAVSIITSGDIDAVYIFLYTVSKYWTRNADGKFTNSVYVILQKPRGKTDVYNITAMLEILEEAYADQNIGFKVAFALCLGGNDFYPKCHGISHVSVLQLAIENELFRNNLFSIVSCQISVNKEFLKIFYQTLYCPKRYLKSNLSYDQVRSLTVGMKENDSTKGYHTHDPRKWLPPAAVVEKLGQLLDIQIAYLQTAGRHESPLPDIFDAGCFIKTSSGETIYNFGPDAHFTHIAELPKLPVKLKRTIDTTPQKGARRKRMLTSTPNKIHH